ncbi:MAG: iron-only hydrogenase system regulator [Candidatus Marinimicrobia bacterium]|nr:iron-only hydrogenase system regulator [Candidatus Neomarinimicrobiota bacterium]RKY58399.1 MAG: iron-only hydrogenase system regulator [Candidatus Neomarinimicrobiota bacterium]
MEKKLHTTTITVYDRDASYQQVGELLHNHAKNILLRVGYPLERHNAAIIFLILEMTTDELGALTGKLGQIPTVKVKSTTLKI